MYHCMNCTTSAWLITDAFCGEFIYNRKTYTILFLLLHGIYHDTIYTVCLINEDIASINDLATHGEHHTLNCSPSSTHLVLMTWLHTGRGVPYVELLSIFNSSDICGLYYIKHLPTYHKVSWCSKPKNCHDLFLTV